MQKKSILVVDDEKNIRLTLSRCLEPLGLVVETAINGEEALQKLEENEFGLLLLDLKMPGMDGMEVLHQVRQKWPQIIVIIITAHGTIDSAVEAMKLGAVDFIQKPFSPKEIREIVTQALERESLNADEAVEYEELIDISKRYIIERRFSDAREMTQKAIAKDPEQPEAYNLLGALFEIDGDTIEAQKFYRAALDIDPTFKPAWSNLERVTSWHKYGKIELEKVDKNIERKEMTDKEDSKDAR
ncbi:MAG: response regulator [Desulfobacterales bacterium]|nr:response regulator [Desulfobacterales bacterium]